MSAYEQFTQRLVMGRILPSAQEKNAPDPEHRDDEAVTTEAQMRCERWETPRFVGRIPERTLLM